MRRVAVIGGGAVGVTVAYYLARRDVPVTLFDGNEIGHGASFGNAGLLVPSYSVPLATAGNALEGIRSLLGRPSAVDVKIWPTASTIAWVLRFLAATRSGPTQRGLKALSAFALRSLTLYDDLLHDAPAEIDYARNGTLYVSRTANSLAASAELAGRLQAVGIRSKIMDRSQARAHEPTLSDSVAGGVWYPDDGRLQPLNFVRHVAGLARALGAEFCAESITGFTRDGSGVTGVRTADQSFEASRVVIAAGTWSPSVVRPLGLHVPILPAKGYSFDLELADAPRTSMLFAERHVSVTPMNNLIRATTGLDFHGHDARVRQARIDLIHTAYREYLAEPRFLAESPAWAGFRPLTPDGLPIVGPSSRIGNVIFATGHGPLGVTLAPATAQAVAGTILDESFPIAREILPARFRL